jgi:hypothetical protein
MNELPRRPFTELSAPTGGLADARRVATRRRRAKAAVASTASAAAVAVVLALAGSSPLSDRDSLRVTSPGESGSPVPTATDAPTPASTSASQQPASNGTPEPGSSPGSAGSVGVGSPEESSSPRPVSSPVSGGDSYVTPDLSRTYFAADQSLVYGGTHLCGGSTTRDDTNTGSTINWCHSALVTKTTGGHTLAAQLCRDGSSGKQLTFQSTREVDLQVKRGGKTVWRWSVGHTFASEPHVLQVEADHCWRWTLSWGDVDGAGKALPSGNYELWVTSYGAEMAANPETSVGFTL